MTLEEINSEVQRRAAEQHGAVLFGVFVELKKEHLKGSPDCDCNYCRALHQYVMLKRARRAVRRRAYDLDEIYPDDQFFRKLMLRYEELLVIVRAARFKKNLAKEII